MEDADLVVVGGGPAGSAAALRFLQLRPSSRVVVLDKAKFPRDKVCGDGLGPDAVSEIAALGATDVLSGRTPIVPVALQSPSGHKVSGVPPRPGFVVPRFELDAGLIQTAQKFGAELRHERVDDVCFTPSGVVVNESFRARTVIAADGSNSRVRTVLSQGRAPDKHAAFAVRGYAVSDTETLEIRWESRLFPAYSWIFPTGNGTANIGFGCLHSGLSGDRIKDQLWEALSDTVELKPVDGSLRAHRLPFTSARLSRTFGPVLFAGDAAGMINPLSGEGIYYALATGRLAAAAAALSDTPAHTYEKDLQRLFGSHFRSTSIAHRLQRLPRNIDAAVRSADRSRIVFEDLVEISLGRGKITNAMVAGVASNWFNRR